MEFGEIFMSIISFVPETYFGSKKIRNYYNKYYKNHSIEELCEIEKERIDLAYNSYKPNPYNKPYEINKK